MKTSSFISLLPFILTWLLTLSLAYPIYSPHNDATSVTKEKANLPQDNLFKRHVEDLAELVSRADGDSKKEKGKKRRRLPDLPITPLQRSRQQHTEPHAGPSTHIEPHAGPSTHIELHAGPSNAGPSTHSGSGREEHPHQRNAIEHDALILLGSSQQRNKRHGVQLLQSSPQQDIGSSLAEEREPVQAMVHAEERPPGPKRLPPVPMHQPSNQRQTGQAAVATLNRTPSASRSRSDQRSKHEYQAPSTEQQQTQTIHLPHNVPGSLDPSPNGSIPPPYSAVAAPNSLIPRPSRQMPESSRPETSRRLSNRPESSILDDTPAWTKQIPQSSTGQSSRRESTESRNSIEKESWLDQYG